jgi:PAS domain S-box-containing protein
MEFPLHSPLTSAPLVAAASAWAAGLPSASVTINALTGLALLSIAGGVITLVRRTRIPYPGLFVIFAVCLASSGAGRLVAAWVCRTPQPLSITLVGILAALSAAVAAVSLRRMMPRLVKAVQGLTLSETRRRMLEDYSDELKAVNKLREREARDFEEIVASSSDQIFRLDAEGRFVYVSPAVTKFFGLSKTELAGKSWGSIPLDDETRRLLLSSQDEVFRTGQEIRGSLSLPSPDGTRHFDFLCSPITETFRVTAVTFNFRDVTEKRVFETELVRAYSEMERRVQQRTEELSASQKQFQDLVNTIDGIVWEADVGRPGFTFVGSQAERITGYPSSKWLGEPRFWQRILHPEDLAKITGDRYLYPEQKKDLQTEYRILTSDDRVRWMRDHVRVIFENDRPTKMRGIMVDVTEQKKAEEALQEEREVSLRAARVKSEFLANMSHEIRTPLNAIVGMSSLALECRVDHEARDCLSTVKTAADSLLMLVNDILDFSKIEAGGVRLELSDFRLRTLVKNAMDVVQPMAAGKKIELRTQPSPKLESCLRGDPGRLQQVLLNLLSNAVKFTPEGGLVSISVAETSRGTFRFEVRDTGIGIAPSVQAALFTPFTQADTSTARKFGGTGLGLSICKRLVELMNGRIGLDSVENQGSTFWFELPLAAAQSTVDVLDEPETPLAGNAGARVLVADDNPANQKVIRRLLEKLGYAAEVVTNGREALTAIRDRRFDAVLMDCQMPEVDGYEATRRLRQLEPPGAHLPVIALTAHALAGDREKCGEAGMDDYLSKPVAIRDLGRALARWTRKSPRSAETPPLALAPPPDEGAAEGEPVLDRDHLETLESLNGHGKSDILIDLARIFFDTAETKLATIRSAAMAGALDQTRFESHSLKSTCFNVGAARLAKVCGEIENLAESGAPDTFAERRELLLRRLEKEASLARAELRGLLESRQAA